MTGFNIEEGTVIDSHENNPKHFIDGELVTLPMLDHYTVSKLTVWVEDGESYNSVVLEAKTEHNETLTHSKLDLEDIAQAVEKGDISVRGR